MGVVWEVNGKVVWEGGKRGMWRSVGREDNNL